MTGFFDELGRERSAAIEAVSMDMGLAFAKSVRVGGHALRAVICFDPFHVVNAVTDALEIVHRELWGQLRNLPDPLIAKKFKGARWTLLKNPGDLSDSQAATLAGIRRHGGAMWRAYLLRKPFGLSTSERLPRRATDDGPFVEYPRVGHGSIPLAVFIGSRRRELDPLDVHPRPRPVVRASTAIFDPPRAQLAPMAVASS